MVNRTDLKTCIHSIHIKNVTVIINLYDDYIFCFFIIPKINQVVEEECERLIRKKSLKCVERKNE